MKTQILDARSDETIFSAIDRAAKFVAGGELVAFPTETVYGLGADAFRPDAIAKIFAAKGRPSDNPLIVHAARVDDLHRCGELGERGRKLTEAFMPGPLTLVVRSRPEVPEIARAGLPTVALRIPNHPVALALLERTGPLVAPSANRSGRPSPTSAAHVVADLDGRIAAVLDGGPCLVGIESTVVDVSGEVVTVLRPGIVTAEEIARVLGEPVVAGAGMSSDDVPRAPGMKYRHYAPSAPVRLVIAQRPPALDADGLRRMALTTARHLDTFTEATFRRELSEESLYAVLREADDLGVDEIVVFAEPGELGAGLLDRIRKAAAG